MVKKTQGNGYKPISVSMSQDEIVDELRSRRNGNLGGIKANANYRGKKLLEVTCTTPEELSVLYGIGIFGNVNAGWVKAETLAGLYGINLPQPRKNFRSNNGRLKGNYPTEDKEAPNSPSRRNSAFELYLKDISDYHLLTPKQEFELARKIRAGDKKSLDLMVTSNLRFVITIAKEYQGTLPLEDLIAEGNLGLVKAASRYDESHGVKFTTYAVWWIRQGISSALAEKAREIRLPVNRIKHLTRLERIASGLRQELGREPTTEEIAEQAEMQLRQVEDLFKKSQIPLSLDNNVFDEDNSHSISGVLEDKTSENPEAVLMEQSLKDEISDQLDSLPPREAQILRQYYGLTGEEPLTLDQIGNQYNLTKERVRQIRDKALLALNHPSRRRLKSYLTDS